MKMKWTMALAILTFLTQAAFLNANEQTLRIKGPKAELTLDANGISIAPSLADCPKVVAKKGPMWSLTLESVVVPPAKCQTIVLTNVKQTVKSETTPEGFRLIYDNLTDGKKTFPVSVKLDFHRDGDAFTVSGEVKNDAKGWLVTCFTGPVIDGLETDVTTHPILLPDGFGRRIKNVPGRGDPAAPVQSFLSPWMWRPAGTIFESTVIYPSGCGTMQWCAFAGEKSGFYFASHDAKHGAKTLQARYFPKEKCFGLVITHRFYCAAGKTWTLPPTVYMPYEGSWHVAAKYYRAWFDRATPLLTTPKWTQNASGWLLCILKQQNGEIMWPYPSLKKMCEVADQHGLDIIGLFGWTIGGHDHLYPEYTPDPKMGGERALRDTLKEVHRLGKRAVIYTNGQLMEREVTEFWRTEGKDLAVVTKDGSTVQETWHKYKNTPAHQFDVACLAADAWGKRMLSWAVMANDLGADGILYDQLGGAGPKTCCSTKHGHPSPDMTYTQDRVDVLRKIVEHMHKINPDFIVMTEGLHDSVLNSISLFHGCVNGVFEGSEYQILARMHKKPAADMFPEMFRYTFPEVMSTNRVPTPMMSRALANYTCLFGFRWEIESRYTPDMRYWTENRMPDPSEYKQMVAPPNIAMMKATTPEVAAKYLKATIEFERKNADLFWHGRFADDEGFTIQGNDVFAKSYAAGDRLGVVVWNPGDKPAKFSLDVPNAELISASDPENAKVDATAELAPQSIRLLVWKKK